MPVEDVLQKLLELPAADQELALLAFEDKRKSQHAAKYWASDPDDKFRRFYDQIEDDFKKLTADIKIYGLLGGNRSSKTERGAFLAVAWLLGKAYFENEPSWRYVKDLPIPEHGCNIWAVGLDFNVIRDVIWSEKLRAGSRKGGLLPYREWPCITRCSDGDFQISVNVDGRKSILTCKSADSGKEKFQSASVDLLWIDEEVDAEVFDECYQRTIDCAGKIILTLTPLADIGSGAKKPWVHELYKKSLIQWSEPTNEKDTIFIKLNTLDNPYIPESEKIKLKEKWAGHPEEGARLYGDFIKRAGLVYDNWNRKIHLVKPFRLEHEWRRIASIDPAPTGVTAVVWAAVDPRGGIYVYRVYYERNKPISEHAADILVRNGNDPIDIWLIDPFFGVQRNAESHKSGQDLYRQSGIPVRLAPKAEDYGREIMREYLEAATNATSRNPKLYIVDSPSCRPLVDEIEGYTWDTFSKGPQRGQTKDKPVKRNDHAINALQYLLSLKPKGRRAVTGPVVNPYNSYS